jgi:protein-tyrosine phosphatase
MSEPREIIVSCYGNICRSPIGEALLQRALDERLGPGVVIVTGGGIGADDGRPPSQGTIRVMAARGFDVRSHRSRLLSPPRAARAWRILCMEDYQVARVREMLPGQEHRVMLWGGEEVGDPLGSGDQAYEDVALQLERLLSSVVDEIAVAIAAEDAAAVAE